MKKSNGVTIIELLLVISMIGILIGITVGIINPQRQRDVAEDGVLNANMVKVCAAIEAYYQGEGEMYPAEGDNNNPLHASAATSSIAAVYIKEWPLGFVYNTNMSQDEFSVHVQQSGTTNFFKCNSTWKNVRECGPTTDPEDIADCD